MKLVHEVGLELRSSAVCTGLRRLRYGHFALAHALLTKHCDARSVVENIEFCRPMVSAAEHSETVRTDRRDDQLDQWKISSDVDDNDDESRQPPQLLDETA